MDAKEVDDIFAGFMRLSERTERLHKIRELRAKIGRQGTECGDCDKWMKSSQCPKEHNVNGYSRGPSYSTPICKEFVEGKSTTEFREKLQKELALLTNTTPTNE